MTRKTKKEPTVHGQFQVVVLKSQDDFRSHSYPGPWGRGLTSSSPISYAEVTNGNPSALVVLPRANERDVDPETLKTTRP